MKYKCGAVFIFAVGLGIAISFSEAFAANTAVGIVVDQGGSLKILPKTDSKQPINPSSTGMATPVPSTSQVSPLGTPQNVNKLIPQEGTNATSQSSVPTHVLSAPVNNGSPNGDGAPREDNIIPQGTATPSAMTASPAGPSSPPFAPQTNTQVAPSQITPSQVVPNQIAPSQIAPSQAVPSQIAPSQAVPNQVVPSVNLPAATGVQNK